ncbi:MAG: hypothetical protein WCJ07_13255, partial [Verrucomicrobiota bacterium]
MKISVRAAGITIVPARKANLIFAFINQPPVNIAAKKTTAVFIYPVIPALPPGLGIFLQVFVVLS